MTDNTKTIWQCPDCGKDGCVNHPANIDVHSAIELVVNDHEKTSPLCCRPWDKLRVKFFED